MSRWGILIIVLVFMSSPAFGNIVGDTMLVEWKFPDIGTAYFSDNVVVPGSTYAGSGAGTITILDGTITIENTTRGWTGSSGFNGFIFTDLSQVPNFTSFNLVSITGSVPPVDPISSFNADQLLVNFNADSTGNLASDLGQFYTFSFTYNLVPLPGSLVLLLTGLAALPVMRTRITN